jgi:hypothetical protein
MILIQNLKNTSLVFYLKTIGENVDHVTEVGFEIERLNLRERWILYQKLKKNRYPPPNFFLFFSRVRMKWGKPLFI